LSPVFRIENANVRADFLEQPLLDSELDKTRVPESALGNRDFEFFGIGARCAQRSFQYDRKCEGTVHDAQSSFIPTCLSSHEEWKAWRQTEAPRRASLQCEIFDPLMTAVGQARRTNTACQIVRCPLRSKSGPDRQAIRRWSRGFYVKLGLPGSAPSESRRVSRQWTVNCSGATIVLNARSLGQRTGIDPIATD